MMARSSVYNFTFLLGIGILSGMSPLNSHTRAQDNVEKWRVSSSVFSFDANHESFTRLFSSEHLKHAEYEVFNSRSEHC